MLVMPVSMVLDTTESVTLRLSSFTLGLWSLRIYCSSWCCCYSLWSYPFLQRWNLPQFCWCSSSMLSYSFTLKLTFPQIHWPKVRAVRQVVSNFVHKERFLIYKVILGNVRVFRLLEVISDADRQYNFPSTP